MVVSEQTKHTLKKRMVLLTSPASVRLLIQMVNQEIVRGTLLSNNPLMAIDLQVSGRHFRPKTNVDRTTNIVSPAAAISRKVVGKNVHSTILRVIWDMINTLFLTL